MREAIQQLIEDYEQRVISASNLMAQTSCVNDAQHFRVAGKREAYRTFIRELKEVLAADDHTSNGQTSSSSTHDTTEQV